MLWIGAKREIGRLMTDANPVHLRIYATQASIVAHIWLEIKAYI